MRLVLGLGSTQLEFVGPRESGAYPWLRSVGALKLVARAGTPGGGESNESPVVDVVLSNEDRQASRLVDCPLRRQATIYAKDGSVYFAGTVSAVGVSQTMRLTVESGQSRLLLHEPLPLRTTRMLGDFADDKPLPLRFGDFRSTRFPLIRLSDTEYLVADHAMTVTRVFVDNELTMAWEQDLRRDDAGNVWTVVRFSAPIDVDSEVSGSGTGMLDPVTGAMIENPADIMVAVLRRCGITDMVFPELRAQAAAEGLKLAHSIHEVKSIRATLDDIALSAGAMWVPGASVLYPATEIVGPVLDLEPPDVPGLDPPVATLADTADILRIGYDVSYVTGRAQKFIELTASPKLYGGVVVELTLPSLRTPANAETVGRRILGRMAGRRYDVNATVRRTDIRPCRRVRLVKHPSWRIPGDDPVVMVKSVEINPDLDSTNISGEALLSVPAIEVTAYSTGLQDFTEGGIDVDIRNGVATFTIQFPDGRPMAGAFVSVDGSPPKVTDARGVVSFTVQQGQHELVVEYPGMQTLRGGFVVA